MRLRGGQAIFVTPSHPLEFLYVFRNTETWAVSNSLVLLVDHFKRAVAYDPHHGAKFTSTAHGIDAYNPC